MSPVCQLQMTLSGGFQGGGGGDGSAGERWGADGLEVLRDLDQRRLTTEAAAQLLVARAPSGVPVIEGVPD
jgi:hypothetical protein